MKQARVFYKVTYLSRNDWTGTYPTATTVVRVTAQMAKNIANEYVPQTHDESASKKLWAFPSSNIGINCAWPKKEGFCYPA